MRKDILHIDINAFFASVEEVLNPELVGKPIAVAGKTKRSVVSAANYVARECGVKSAMPIFEAIRKCKNLIILVPNFAAYQEYSEKFHDFIQKTLTNKIERFSLDECFVDITDVVRRRNVRPVEIAKSIQKEIFKNIGLRTSIGVAYTKFLAKMGSDYKKPMGITEISNEKQIKECLYDQPIENIFFIGKKTAEKIHVFNINTVAELMEEKNIKMLQENFGDSFDDIFNNLRGIGDDDVSSEEADPKSISCSETLLNNSNSYKELRLKLHELCLDAFNRMIADELCCRTIAIVVKTPNFVTTSKSYSFKTHQNNFNTIYLKIIELFEHYYQNIDIRLIGVALSNLQRTIDFTVCEIFDVYQEDKRNTNDLIRAINKKFRRNIVQTAKDKFK